MSIAYLALESVTQRLITLKTLKLHDDKVLSLEAFYLLEIDACLKSEDLVKDEESLNQQYLLQDNIITIIYQICYGLLRIGKSIWVCE
jgi:hypothetical protein